MGKTIILFIILACTLSLHSFNSSGQEIKIPEIEDFEADGQELEWAGLPQIRLYANQYAEYALPEDLLAGFRSGWNHESILFGFKIQDNGYRTDTISPWNGDAIEIYLAPFRGSEDILQIEIVPPEHNSGKCFVKTYDHRKTSTLRKIPVEIVTWCRVSLNERFFEIEVNASSLGIIPEKGSELALQVYVDDADPATRKKNQFQWFPVGHSYLSSFAMYPVVLTRNDFDFPRLTSKVIIKDEKYAGLYIFGGSDAQYIEVFNGDSLLLGTDSFPHEEHEPFIIDLSHLSLNFEKDTILIKTDDKLTGFHELYFAARKFVRLPIPPFDREIRNFVMHDRQCSPPEKPVLFIGSSSIRMWYNLKDYFPELAIIHRGFGGSTMEDALRYMDEIVLPYKASSIVLYEGDNDVAQSTSTDKILLHYRTFISRILKEQPDIKIYLLSPKPSIGRMKLWDKYLLLHEGLIALASGFSEVEFVDVSQIMFNENGTLKKELFIEDGIHMNQKGYDLWAATIRKKLGLDKAVPSGGHGF